MITRTPDGRILDSETGRPVPTGRSASGRRVALVRRAGEWYAVPLSKARTVDPPAPPPDLDQLCLFPVTS